MLLNVEFAERVVGLETLRVQSHLFKQSVFPMRRVLAGRSREHGQRSGAEQEDRPESPYRFLWSKPSRDQRERWRHASELHYAPRADCV
jgi:hypothetical protein